jgi:hypothetical protein
MCWNEDVSLNTFLFSMFVLALVYYNNKYTQYKIHHFGNQWMYVLLTLAFSMQLIEFFLWKNIKNKRYNQIFTSCAFVLVFCQPIASLMLLGNEMLRNAMVTLYLFFGVPYILYIIYTTRIHSVVSSSGNLIWDMNINRSFFWVWLFLLFFSFLYERKMIQLLFAIVSFAIFMYKEHSTAGSVWCWFINSISVYLAVYLLFYSPFIEHNQIC